MAASKKSLLNEIGEDFLSCSICLEFFKNPKVLPCLHTFCEQCLVTFKAKSEGDLKCATCRIQCDTSIQELKSNFFLTSLLDTFQRLRQLSTDHPPMCKICKKKTATHRCVDCHQFSCDVCVKIHEHVPPLRGHQVLKIDKYREIESKGHLTVQSKVFCSDHKDSNLEFYCDTCQVPVCLKCTIVNHRGPEHVHRDLQVVAEEYKTQVREMLEKLKVKEKQADEGKAATESAREEIRNQCGAEKKKVRRRAKELIERVKREEKMLIDDLDERAKSGLKEAAINIDEMDFHHGNIVSTHHYLQTLVHLGNAVHLLSTRTETNKQIMQMVAMEIKPPISHEINEFQPRSDLGANTLLGVQTVGKGQLKDPLGLTINKHGDFVTADRGNRRVVIHDRDGNYKESFEFTDQFAKQFTPSDVAISDDNEYFMTDDNNKQIVVSDENGKLIRKFGSSEIDDPYGIAINPVTNNVYVSEYSKGYIRKYTQGGRYINSLGIQGDKQGELNGPCILAINSKGMVYVADFNNLRIQVFNSDDQFMFEFSTTGDNYTMEYPVGVAIDKNDYVYVSSRHKVTKYDSYGQFICRINCDNNRLSKPSGVAVCSDGKIAVVDWENYCIKVFVE
ncbi:tripartite motif-containing protein 2-like [Saccoglossus kowalevskii]|uniref:Tripartite motif-containing protein 2-like n=1 Tax=Saccoglossus kowalevskii TaxID=10224 RepID=A0ABM0GIY9_SACKO|nr:PREDICTED: tripartite motif-containing protein 2-like [Saccoglossus kowalevskii]